MPYNGSGTFNLQVNFVPDTDARAEDINAVLQDIAAGLSNALTRDGQAGATSPLLIGGFQIKQVAKGTDPTDAINLSQLQSFLPSGTPIPWLAPAIPAGFLLAYGQVLNQADQPGIYAAFGSTYNTGTETSSQFRMPDLRGCVLAGLDNMGGTARNVLTSFGTSGTTLGVLGGEQSHILSVAELAQHGHGVTDPKHGHSTSDPGHAHTYQIPNIDNGTSGSSYGHVSGTYGTSTSSSTTGLSIVTASTGITLQNTGSNTAHNNVQPTMLCNWIIKT